jgi:hypothetical protein
MKEFEFDVEKVTRLEVIDADGRSYTMHDIESMEFSLQDDGRTLKIFVITKPNAE